VLIGSGRSKSIQVSEQEHAGECVSACVCVFVSGFMCEKHRVSVSSCRTHGENWAGRETDAKGMFGIPV
jgi:hypothetical protein